MTTFIKKTALRRSINSLLVVAMLFSLIVVPAFAAEKSTASAIADKGTYLTAFGNVSTSSNGLNGKHSIEVTGQVATQSLLKGTTSGDGAALGDLNVTDAKDFVIEYPAGVDTTITGLSLTSKVSDVLAAISSQVTSLTVGRDTIGRITLQAKSYGAIAIRTKGNVASKVFGSPNTDGVGDPIANGTYGYRFDLGKDYDGTFAVTDRFVSSEISSFTVAPNPEVGSLDAYTNEFVPGAKLNGLYTAIRLAPGYDVVLTTNGSGIGKGTVDVTVGGGVRDAVKPKVTVDVKPGMTVQAGAATTFTVSVEASSAKTEYGVDGFKLALPEGFVLNSAGATSTVGQISVDAVARTVALDSFFINGSKVATLTFTAKAPTKANADGYSFIASYKNIGGSAFTDMTVDQKLVVVAEDVVKDISFDAPAIARAGQTVVVGAHLLDQYGNEVKGLRTVTGSAVSVPATAAATVNFAATQDAFYGWKTNVALSPKATSVNVKFIVANGAKEETSKTVSIATGAGAPNHLAVVAVTPTATVGTNASIRVRTVDAAGNQSAFLSGEAPAAADITVVYGPLADGSYGNKTVSIPVGQSEGIATLTSAVKADWNVWAFEAAGRLAKSDIATQKWIAVDEAAAYKSFSVTASPAMAGESEKGYAAADGASAVTFSVKTNVAAAGRKFAVAIKSGPGVLSAKEIVTDANGVATVSITSNAPSGLDKNNSSFYSEVEFTEVATSGKLSGFAHFYTPEVRGAVVDKTAAYADGKDAVKFTFAVKNPLTGAAVPAGVRIFFSTDSGSVLSAPSALTDANGNAVVYLTRDTATTDLVGVAARDFSGNSTYSSVDHGVGASFYDYLAFAQGAVTAQQSERGSEASARMVIKDSAGNVVNFSKLQNLVGGTNVDSVSGSQDGTAAAFDVDVVFDAPDSLPAVGSVLNGQIQGEAVIEGPFTSSDVKTFGANVAATVVNNAVASAKGSTVLGSGSISGSGLREGEVLVEAMLGSTAKFLAWGWVEADGTLSGSFTLPTGFVAGSYDLIVDGIKFPGALVVSNTMDIGTTTVFCTMTSNVGTGYVVSGTKVLLSGAVVNSKWLPIASPTRVNVYSSAAADGSNATLVGSALTDADGRFSFTTSVTGSRYFWAVSDANARFLSADSRVTGITKVSVKTKTTMKVTSAPKTIGVNRSFTSKGSIAGGHGKATTVAFKIYRSNGSLYKTYSVSIAAGQKSFSKTGMKIGSKGTFYVKAFHSDYNHSASTSAGWKVVVK